MATLAPQMPATRAGDRFFANLALGMCLITVAGFVVNLAFARSTFHSPLVTHVHAVTFMGWIVLFITQSRLGVGESRALHRTLGWIATGWTLWMLVMGMVITVSMVRRGAVPFFFEPQYLMIVDPFTLIAFAGITWWAVSKRRETDWHSRLHIGAMTMLVPPGVGRLLPMPLLQPWAYEWAAGAALIFPLIGAVRDKRKSGRVHPAWFVPFAAMLVAVVAGRVVAFSPIGDAAYHTAVAGSLGETIPGRERGTPHP